MIIIILTKKQDEMIDNIRHLYVQSVNISMADSNNDIRTDCSQRSVNLLNRQNRLLCSNRLSNKPIAFIIHKLQ